MKNSLEIMQKMAMQQAQADFASVVKRLPSMVGERNTSLPWICRLGLRAGLTDDQLCETILRSCGRPRLSEAEVRRGISAAKLPLEARSSGSRLPIATAAERRFVSRMIELGRGTTVEGLQASAGLDRTENNRFAAAARQVQAMLAVDRTGANRFDLMTKFWIGSDKSSGSLRTGFDLVNGLGRGDFGLARIPNFITCNALTGRPELTKDGMRKTFRGDACVVAPKLALVEFDGLSREDQLAFVGGVLNKRCLRVVTVVDSGNRSLHTIVEVEGAYPDFKTKVLRLMSSSSDRHQRIDRAVFHPSALTRLAGARRPDTGRLQELIWARMD